jgi:hypothetical protein
MKQAENGTRKNNNRLLLAERSRNQQKRTEKNGFLSVLRNYALNGGSSQRKPYTPGACERGRASKNQCRQLF